MKYLALLILLSLTHIVSTQQSINKIEYQNQVKMIVYGSDTCHYCIETKAYLKEQKIDFIFYDVDINIEKQNEMLLKLRKANIPLSNLSLPVIDKNGDIFLNEGKFEDFLKKLNAKNNKDENN